MEYHGRGVGKWGWRGMMWVGEGGNEDMSGFLLNREGGAWGLCRWHDTHSRSAAHSSSTFMMRDPSSSIPGEE